MVEWDESLAASAAVHAKRCQFAHSTPDQLYHPVYRHQIGENLAVFRGPSKFVNDLFVWIVDGFYEERKYYDYKTSGCTAECGHYEGIKSVTKFILITYYHTVQYSYIFWKGLDSFNEVN